MKKLNLYFLKEFFSVFFISIFFITGLLLIDKIFDYAGIIFSHSFDLKYFLDFIFKTVLSLIVFTMPLSWISGIIFTNSKMLNYREFLAIKSAGIDLRIFFLPVLFLSFTVSILLIYHSNNIAPDLIYKSKKVIYKFAKNIDVFLQENTFITIADYTVYFSKKSKKNDLKNIVIYKREGDTGQIVITARRGKFYRDEENNIFVFTLFDGSFQKRDFRDLSKYISSTFTSYTVKIELSGGNKVVSRRWREMNTKELKKEIKKLKQKNIPYHMCLLEYYLRFAFGGSLFFLALFSIPISLWTKFHHKMSYALFIGIFFLYYLIFIGGLNLVRGGQFPPIIAAFLPDFIFLLFGVYFYFKMK